MSEYGVKIKNIRAGSLYEYNLGVRDKYDYVDAMFTNSLFLDFLLENGLKVKNNSTRDIIDLDFNYSSKSYEEERKKLDKLLSDENKCLKNETNEKKKDKIKNKISTLEYLSDFADRNKEKFIKKSKDEIRIEYYQNGVTIGYPTFYKNGDIKKVDIYHYKMLYRSTGKAKKGSCIFIVDRLYKKAKDFLTMKYKMPKQNAPIVEMCAYSSLIASTIVGKIKINPKNILILKDIDSFMTRDVISIEIDENKHCYAKNIKNYQLKNTLFDGQGLIDRSIFPSWADGYVLLRHHMCKMACFKTNIQQFFRDYCHDNNIIFETFKVKDMFGNEHFAKDIELITTDNAMKWLKFQISYDYWCDRVYENNCMFGVVKTAHPSKLGDVQKMSYQMVNSLNLETMDEVVDDSVKYIELLKSDDYKFIEYLKKNVNFSNDFDVLVALCEQNWDFTRSEYYRNRKRAIIDAYVSKFKTGKVLQNADNLTLVGSPYAMLLHSVGEDVEKDDSFNISEDYIECYTNRFDDGEELCGFRSPHNSCNNIIALKNNLSSQNWKYFDFGKQILAVNVLHTDVQDRANGCDFDSDSFYVTSKKQIVEHAKKCYKDYPTIVNNVPKSTNKYDNTMLNYAIIDNKLASSQLGIGESSNLAQLALSYSYNFSDKKYSYYVCILSVLAQICIDSAKRTFDMDTSEEIKRIKKDMDILENGYPKFWSYIKRDVNKNKINNNINCPMNHLCNIKIKEYKPKSSTLKMSYFFQKTQFNNNERRKSKKVEELIEKYSLELLNSVISLNNDTYEDYILLREDFDELINDIRKIYISKNYEDLMCWLVDRAFCITNQVKVNNRRLVNKTNKNKTILLKVLYTINPKILLKIFSKNA